MGLSLEVGMLADLLVHDEEGAGWLREEITKLNATLEVLGLAPHVEPTELGVWSAPTYGYSGLHHLRRCAAHLEYQQRLPPTSVAAFEASKDGLLNRYGAAFASDNADLSYPSFARPSFRRFDHLMIHSDCEGYYLPQRFDPVIVEEGMKSWIGSSQVLLEECKIVARALELPRSHLDGEEFDDQFYDEIGKSVTSTKKMFWEKRDPIPLWKQHSIAALVCAKLHYAAEYSVKTGALLVFC